MANKPKDNESVLPPDIIQTILLKLPLRTILKFKSVCKSWQALMSDPRFMEIIHIERQKLHNLFLLWGPTPHPHTPSRSFSLVKFEDGRFRIESELGIPFGHAIPLCSYNHLVLLWPYDAFTSSDEYVLWNPSIRTYSKIPKISPRFSVDSYGLFHDSRTDNYKVVVVSSFHMYYAVFSCKRRSWGVGWISFPSLGFPRDVEIRRRKKGVFFYGSFYWWNRDSKLVCYNFRDYKMKVLMQLPGQRKVKGCDGDRLIVLSGRLCLFRRRISYSGGLQMWVMERDGEGDCYYWRELMNMNFQAPHLLLDEPMCLTKEDDVVFMTKSTSMFIVYKYSEKRFEESWRFSSFERMSYGDIMIPCSESPFFPIDGREINH